ncbi:MAG: (2Fe-2S)-binding protein [Xanthobacteraceae bacterium]
MIVCSCHVISDDEVKTACSEPQAPQTMAQIYRRLGRRPTCGRCAHTIRNMMRKDGKRGRSKAK